MEHHVNFTLSTLRRLNGIANGVRRAR